MKSYNQHGQEIWVREVLNNKKDGFFVDIGAFNGVVDSNSYFLEKELNWKGICVEANPEYYWGLSSARSCHMINAAVMPYSGYCLFQGINTYPTTASSHPNAVKCFTLNEILDTFNAPKDIDYMSLDIEGHEFDVLSTLDFARWNIHLLTIEHNSYLVGPGKKNLIHNLMTSKGYTRVKEDVLCQFGPFEDWYQKSEKSNAGI